MTDINELGQPIPAGKFMFEVCGQRWHHIKHGEAQYTEPRLPMVKLYHEDAVALLVEALEKAQRANAAQDDHINQQQDRIDTLEKNNAELGRHVVMLEKRLRETEESLISSVDMVRELESLITTVKGANQ